MEQLNEDKYRSAILYFAQHIHNLGKVKLWKLLFYLDFDHYERHHVSVTGEVYLRWDNGPVPKHGALVLERMAADGDVVIHEEPPLRPGYHPQMKVVALHPADKSVFSESEWDTLLSVARKWKYHTGRDMIHATHGEPSWQQTEPNAVIDYALALERDKENSSPELDGDEETMSVDTAVQVEREKTLALAQRIEDLWDSDPRVRDAIERGIAEMQAGQGVFFHLDEK